MVTPSPSSSAEAHVAERYYLLHRLVQVVGAGFLALLATSRLATLEAGFFFTLGSLTAAQILLDAGSSMLLVAHLGRCSHQLRWQDGQLHGPLAVRRRAGWLAAYAVVWGLFSALLAGLVLAPLSLRLLAGRPEIELLAHWRAAVQVTVAGVALSQLGSAVPVAMEGLGQVARVSRLRALQDAFAYSVALGCMVAGQGLWALAALWCVRGALGLAWSAVAARPLRALGRSRSHRALQRALWPMQWRLASSWAAGYLSQQSLVPLAYSLLGPRAAAQLGLAFFCTNGLQIVAGAWAAARMPEFAALAAARRWAAFDALLSRALRAAAGTALVGGAAMLLALLVGRVLTDWAERLPAPTDLLLLVLTAPVVAAIVSIATALRACGREPFLAVSLTGGVLSPLLMAGGAHLGGSAGLCAACLLLNGGVALPWARALLAEQRRTRGAGT